MISLKETGTKIWGVLKGSLSQSPRFMDALILSVFTVFITCNPYYLNNRINMYELSLYLPGIEAIQHGLIPFRDFFHLRGPLELYMPTWMMGLWGSSVQVMCFYFFFGNVLCLVLIVLIARELIRTRFIFYMMIPVIVARTFPRVCFMNWGGMRYVFGLMAVFCLIRFLKNKRLGWMAAAGLSTAAAALTSIEIGICAGMAVVGTLTIGGMLRLIKVKEVSRALIGFVGFGLLGIAPWIIYSLSQHAFIPYLDALQTIMTRFLIVINPHLSSVYPSNLSEALAAMFNPGNANFKQLTPAYAYVFLLGYLIWRWRKGQCGISELSIVAVSIYGFVLYTMAFRALLASQFEMALMPQKLVHFFLIEVFVLWLWGKASANKGWKTPVIAVLLIALFVSSLAYAISRYNNRFWAYQFSRKCFGGKKY